MVKRILYLIFILSIICVHCEKLSICPSSTTDHISDFERAWAIVDSVYPYFEYKGIDWNHIYEIYRPKAENARGDEFLEVLCNMLGELKDAHVKIKLHSPIAINTYECPRTTEDKKTYNPLVVRKYFVCELKLAGGNRMEYEITQNNIGYIYISTFEGGNWNNEIDDILEYLKNTKGLIIDIRNNSGGTLYSTDKVISRFIDSPLEHPPLVKGSDTLEWQVIFPKGPFQYKNDIVVLINGATLSAAESFAELMKTIPSVTAVGKITGGAGGSAEDFILPGGIIISVTTINENRYDGEPIEWNGVLPDILIDQSSNDIENKRDLQFEYAEYLLNEQ